MSLKSLLAAAAMAASLALPAAAQEPETPVYLIASLTVPNLERYMGEYGMPVFPMLLGAGGEILVGAPAVEVLEGQYASNWTVIVRFPSEAAAKGWYASPEYRELIPVRQALTDVSRSTMLLAPQFTFPAVE